MQLFLDSKPLWLNYHHLYYFQIIATEGSIAKAAEKLRLGQPTLSTQLKQFEEKLGIKLFNRSHKKLVLSEAGKTVLNYAHEIFKIGNELIEVIHDRKLPERTHIQIGALDSVPKHLILEVAKEVLKNKKCAVTILEGKAKDMLFELQNHRIDLFLSNFHPSSFDTPFLNAKSIVRAPVYLFGSKKFLPLKKNFPQSILGAPFILPTREHSALRSEIETYLHNCGITFELIAETQDTSLQKMLAIDGVGIIAKPLFAVTQFVESKELYEIGKLEGIYEELFIISTKRKIENPISSQIMKSFRLSSS